MKSIIVIVVLVWSTSIHAQEQKVWSWVAGLGGADWDMSNGLVTDSKSNIYVAGAFTGSLESGKHKVTSAGGRDIYVARFTDKGKLDYLWSAGGERLDKITAMDITPDDKLIISGIVTGEVSINGENYDAGEKSIFVATLDKKAKTKSVLLLPYSGVASAFKISSQDDGGLIIGGHFSAKLCYETQELTSQGYKDIFLLSIDTDGSLKSLQSIGGAGDQDLSSLACHNGQIALSASYKRSFSYKEISIEASPNEKNSLILVLDNAFAPLYSKQFYSKQHLDLCGVTFDKQGNLVWGANYIRDIKTDSTTYKSQGSKDFILGKLNTQGESIWTKTFGSENYESLHSLSVNTLGGGLISGSFSDSLLLDTFSLKVKSPNRELFVANLLPDGKVVWANNIGGDKSKISRHTVIDKDGNLYISGSFRGELKKENQKLQSKGKEDVFVASYCNCPPSDGLINGQNFIYAGEVNTLQVPFNYNNVLWNDSIRSRKLHIDKPGVYFVRATNTIGCILQDTINVEPALPFSFNLGNDTSLQPGEELLLQGPEEAVSYHWQDASTDKDYLASSFFALSGQEQYSLCAQDLYGAIFCDTLTITYLSRENINNDSLDAESVIEIYPNPIDNKITWCLNSDEWSEFDVILSNSMGIVVYQKSIKNYEKLENHSINASHLPIGNYALKVVADDGRTADTVVIKE